MAAETSPITESYQSIPLTERQLLEDIYTRLGRLEMNLSILLNAWSVGGLRGLRQASRGNFAARPDPDGTRAAFLAAGLHGLEDHDA